MQVLLASSTPRTGTKAPTPHEKEAGEESQRAASEECRRSGKRVAASEMRGVRRASTR